MDIRDYEYIVAIAEQGSITRAAAQLFITQSALTKFLQRTEKNLGISLFVKKGNQFLLTEAGREYVETGRRIMQMDRELDMKLAQEAAVQKKQIRLGYGMGRAGYILGEILPQFYEKYPDVCVYTKAETSRQQILQLARGELDLVLVTNMERMPGYQYLPVDKSCLALAVRKDSPIMEQAKEKEGYPYPAVDRSVLETLRFVNLPATTNSGNLFREIFRKHKLHSEIILEVSDVRSLIDAVEIGLGAAIFMTVPVGTKNICYLSVEGMETVEQTTSLVFKSDKNLSGAMKYLMELIAGKSPL